MLFFVAIPVVIAAFAMMHPELALPILNALIGIGVSLGFLWCAVYVVASAWRWANEKGE